MIYRVWARRAREMEERKGVKIPRPSYEIFKRRDRRMREAGLLPWERFWLISHKLNTPGMKYMLQRRRDMVGEARKRGITLAEWNRRIKEWYRTNGWTFNDGTLNPFKMFEWFRDKKNLDVTPSPKKRVVRKDYREYKERTLASGR